MRSFFDIVGFEYKKIFKRKSAIIAMIIVTVAVCLSPMMIFFGTVYIDGEPYESQYQAMVKDREYARALSGRAVDETLMREAQEAYSKIPAGERYTATPEYQQYARPYSEVVRMMRAAYNIAGLSDLAGLTNEEMGDYYQVRHEIVTASIRAGAISDAAKDTLIKLDSEIKAPFVFEYSDGFDNIIGGVYTLGIACAFALTICFAPMFAGEYSSRADQLILSSKLGKNKLISAKLFTVISLFAAFFMLLIFLVVALCALIYGLDGANAPFQLITPLDVFPITLSQAVLLYGVSTFFGTFLIVAITLLLSSKFKSPFGVIIVISVLLFAPMMFNSPETVVWLHNLLSLIPSNMMTYWTVFSRVPFGFFGLVVMPYVFLPIFAILVSIAMLPFARRAFQNHQIG